MSQSLLNGFKEAVTVRLWRQVCRRGWKGGGIASCVDAQSAVLAAGLSFNGGFLELQRQHPLPSLPECVKLSC